MSGVLRRIFERIPASAPLVRLAAEWQVRRAVHAAGCEVKITREAVDMIRGTQIVRLSPKHLVFAPEEQHLANVDVREVADAGSSGRLRFNSEGSLGAALSHVVSRAGLSQTIEVTALTLADACAAAGRTPNFIKMDVEGAEEEVLVGAREWLVTNRPRWVIDTHHRIGGKFTDAAVEKALVACRYRAWTELVGGFRTTFAVPEEMSP